MASWLIFPPHTNITLEPGEEYEYQESKMLSVGDYFAEPVKKINGEWGGIDNANRVYFTVKVPSPGATPIPTPPLSTKPEGKADYLVVLVHGCCTDANDIRNEWYPFGRLIAERIVRKSDWEIVVWDWHKNEETGVDQTPDPPIWNLEDFKERASIAYKAAAGDEGEGNKLANAINEADDESPPKYKYIHLIAHSAGSKLIDEAAKRLSKLNEKDAERPFIHLTFLDAYTQHAWEDTDNYGSLPNDYLKHYAEHYVDITPSIIAPWTNMILPHAFNFDITGWKHTQGDGFFGHSWPVNWYIQSITASEIDNDLPKPGLPLSHEGGNNGYDQLSTRFPPNGTCSIIDEVTWFLCGVID